MRPPTQRAEIAIPSAFRRRSDMQGVSLAAPIAISGAAVVAESFRPLLHRQKARAESYFSLRGQILCRQCDRPIPLPCGQESLFALKPRRQRRPIEAIFVFQSSETILPSNPQLKQSTTGRTAANFRFSLSLFHRLHAKGGVRRSARSRAFWNCDPISPRPQSKNNSTLIRVLT